MEGESPLLCERGGMADASDLGSDAYRVRVRIPSLTPEIYYKGGKPPCASLLGNLFVSPNLI